MNGHTPRPSASLLDARAARATTELDATARHLARLLNEPALASRYENPLRSAVDEAQNGLAVARSVLVGEYDAVLTGVLVADLEDLNDQGSHRGKR